MADTLSNFNTDYYGMKQFKNIMESQGIVSKDDLKEFLMKAVDEMASEDNGAVHYLDFNNGLSVVLAYEPGFDPEDDNALVDSEGYAICASVRETGSSHMVEDWTNLTESTSLSQSDVDEGFATIADYLYDIILHADPEEEDEEEVDREETIFDELEDFKGSFDEWVESINADNVTTESGDIVTVSDVNLEKVTSPNGYVGDGVVFTLNNKITDADHDKLDDSFTSLMPLSIVEFVDKHSFDYVVVDANQFAFVVW